MLTRLPLRVRRAVGFTRKHPTCCAGPEGRNVESAGGPPIRLRPRTAPPPDRSNLFHSLRLCFQICLRFNHLRIVTSPRCAGPALPSCQVTAMFSHPRTARIAVVILHHFVQEFADSAEESTENAKIKKCRMNLSTMAGRAPQVMKMGLRPTIRRFMVGALGR